MIKYAIFTSNLGEIFILEENNQIIGCYFKDQKYFPDINSMVLDSKSEVLSSATLQLEEYFKGLRKSFNISIKLKGTEFQMKVWNELLNLSYNENITYLELARRLSNEKAVRAVANAVGKNPISIIIPCHRVIGSDGSLTGYAAGLDIKKKLINRENS